VTCQAHNSSAKFQTDPLPKRASCFSRHQGGTYRFPYHYWPSVKRGRFLDASLRLLTKGRFGAPRPAPFFNCHAAFDKTGLCREDPTQAC
jgi:hypothetical protein